MNTTAVTRRALVAAMLFAAATMTAAAQTYPERMVRVIVPFPPGGPVDVVARIVTQALPQILGQNVIVENRPGASGTIGARLVAASAPDGYTILFGNISSLVVTPVVTNNRDFDPEQVFTPVAKTSQNVQAMIVHPDFPARSVRELVAYSKANPGKLNYGSAGVGNASQLAVELFKVRTGADITHVPYKGAADAITGVMAGQVHLFMGDIGGVLPLIREGQVRALAISGEERSAETPTLPTMIESGVPGYVALTYTGVVAPAGTPPEIVGKLNTAINTALRTPDAAAALRRIGADSAPASPAEFSAFLSKERDKWREVVRLSGIRIE